MMKSGFHLMGFLLSAGMLLSSCSTGLRVNPMITQEELVASVGFLASDSLKGRYPGTPEDSVLSAYLADALKSAGASLLFEEGRQYFDVTVSLVPAPDNVLVYGGKNASADHFTPMDFSGGTAPEAELLVLGYGFEIDEPDLRWDDYSGADVQGKWVLLLRGDPEPENPRSAFATHSEDYSKVITARDHGAAGVLLVSGPGWDAADQLTRLSERRGNACIPVLHIRRVLADSLLAGAGTSVEKLESLLNNTRKPRMLRTGMVRSKRGQEWWNETAGTSNVVALLPGVDSLLKDEYILLGAHKDHLGMGGTGSSSRHPDTVAVHNGADDNASGLAALLEIAQKIGAQRQQLRRSLLLVAFGAEEMGLIGSKYFADNPPIPLQQVVAMVNLDMVGRLKSDSTLAIGGTGTSEHSENLLNGLPRDAGPEAGLCAGGLWSLRPCHLLRPQYSCVFPEYRSASGLPHPLRRP
jgi:aminopeptidase YwaD